MRRDIALLERNSRLIDVGSGFSSEIVVFRLIGEKYFCAAGDVGVTCWHTLLIRALSPVNCFLKFGDGIVHGLFARRRLVRCRGHELAQRLDVRTS